MAWAYSFSDGESWVGGFDTRDAAIAEATAEGDGAAQFLVGEESPVMLPNPFDGASVCERADEILNDDVCFDDPVFDATVEQLAELETQLWEVWKAWCERHKVGDGFWHVPKYEKVVPATPSGNVKP
jgi:hypothetical protein